MAKLFKNRSVKKKILAILACSLMLVCSVAAFGACKGKNKEVDAINITKSNMPQTMYILGQDLNLADGKLTIVVDGQREEVALTDENVTITGYDRNVLGEQVLTVTYKGKETILKVTVVERMTVEYPETQYFVGEPMNMERGSFTITNDDGTAFSVPMDDASITITGFSTAEAKEAMPVTATYAKDGVSYSTTFNVTVYGYTDEDVSFRQPNKQSYNDFDTAIDLTGGLLTFTAGDFSREVVVTKDMVSGFNPAAATVANRGNNPLEQTITVSYLNVTKTYTVQIKYSDVSFIKYRANEMSSLNWTSNELPEECSETMAKNAVEAMQVYFAMPENDVKNIPEGNAEIIAKVAAMYGLNVWKEAFASYSDAFYLRDGTTLTWDCSDVEKTRVAYEKILNKDPILYDDAALLIQIKEAFPEVKVFEDDTVSYTISDMLAPVYSSEVIDEFAGQLGMMLGLHDALKTVPSGLTAEELRANYATEIQNAWVIIYESPYKAIQQRSLYLLVSKWRAENDYFEILYDFYYGHPDANEAKKINDFKDLRLPGELEVLYSYLLEARNYIAYMQNWQWFESTQFMYTYELALEKKAEILASDNQMWIDLYNTLEFDYMVGDGNGGYKLSSFDQLFSSFRTTSMGYVSLFNTYYGIPEYEELWNDYMDVLMRYYEEKNENKGADPDIQKYAADIENLLKDYLALSPKQQFGFMVMLQPRYMPSMEGRYPGNMWAVVDVDGENTYYNEFVALIYKYYYSVLPESTHEIFNQYMLGAEALANLQVASTIGQFLDPMANITELKSLVERDDWTAFNDIAGWIVLKYQAIEDKFAGLRVQGGTYTVETLSEEAQKDFDDLLAATCDAYTMMILYQMNQQGGGPNLAMAFWSKMEEVEKISAKILSSEDPAVLRAYYFDEMILPGQWLPDQNTGAWGSMNWGGTMDFLVWLIRDVYVDSLTGASFLKAGNLVWDSYTQMGVKDFLADAADIYHTYLFMQLRPQSDPNYQYFADEEMMMDMMAAFQGLTNEQRHFLYVLDPSCMFMSAYVRFARERNVNLTTIVEKLMDTQRMYAYYTQKPDGAEGGRTYKEMLLTKFSDLQRQYNNLLTNAENEAKKEKPDEAVVNAITDFEHYFGDVYNFYKTECEALQAE